MSFVNPFRRLRTLRKRVFGEIIKITETLVTTLQVSYVYLSDSLVRTYSILIDFATTETISIGEGLKAVILLVKSLTLEDAIQNITLRIREPLSITKSELKVISLESL